MAVRTVTQLKALYGTSGSLFPDNTTGEISEADVRAFGEDLADSNFNKTDDAFTGAKGQRSGVTTPASLKGVATLSLPFNTIVTLVDSGASNVVRIYDLQNETTAESLPDVVRPDDYAGTTNEKVWRLRSTGSAGTVTSVTGTSNRITSTGGATPSIDISATFEGLLGKVAQRIDQNNSATTSAQLAGVISDETGSGALVFATSPTLVTPALGTPSAVVLTNGTGLPGTAVINTPAGNIAATTAQAAINELDTEKQALINSATALTDASTMDLTAIKHTLTTSSATRTFTISYTGDNSVLAVTLNTTSSTFTFPSGALCVSDGAFTGDNTCPLVGASGDTYIIVTQKIGSVYFVVCKCFGQ